MAHRPAARRAPSGAFAAVSARSDYSAEIASLESALRAAMLAGDVDALDRLISERLLFAGPTGELATKADDLRAHRERIIKFLRHEPESVEMRRVSDDCFVVSQATELEVALAGAVHRGKYRYIRVWTREADGWRILAGQVAAIQPAS
jgi:ketosteroid isomerase-like protein